MPKSRAFINTTGEFLEKVLKHLTGKQIGWERIVTKFICRQPEALVERISCRQIGSQLSCPLVDKVQLGVQKVTWNGSFSTEIRSQALFLRPGGFKTKTPVRVCPRCNIRRPHPSPLSYEERESSVKQPVNLYVTFISLGSISVLCEHFMQMSWEERKTGTAPLASVHFIGQTSSHWGPSVRGIMS